MNIKKKTWLNTWLKCDRLLSQVITFALTAVVMVGGLIAWQPSAAAILAQGDAVTDPQAILRYALPIENDSVRKLQKSLEGISSKLRAKRWKNISRNISDASFVLSTRREKLLASVPEERKPQAEAVIDSPDSRNHRIKRSS